MDGTTKNTNVAVGRVLTMTECNGLIRVDIPDVEVRRPDGTTERMEMRRFLGTPERAAEFGDVYRQQTLGDWGEVAADVGMDRDHLLTIARALHRGEERRIVIPHDR